MGRKRALSATFDTMWFWTAGQERGGGRPPFFGGFLQTNKKTVAAVSSTGIYTCFWFFFSCSFFVVSFTRSFTCMLFFSPLFSRCMYSLVYSLCGARPLALLAGWVDLERGGGTRHKAGATRPITTCSNLSRLLGLVCILCFCFYGEVTRQTSVTRGVRYSYNIL